MTIKNLGALAMAIVAAASLVGFALWWDSREIPVELIRLKNVAVGHLENAELKDFRLAAPLFEQLVRELPDDPLGHRDYLIALFAPTGSGDSATKDAFPEDPDPQGHLLAATEAMLHVEPNSAAAEYLAGVVYANHAEHVRWQGDVFKQSLESARRHFQRTVELSPRDPAPWFQLYDLEQHFGNPDVPSDEAVRSLQAALRCAPDNLYLQAEWLLMQTSLQRPELRDAVAQLLRHLPANFKPEVIRPLREAEVLLGHNKPDEVSKAADLARGAAMYLKVHPAAMADQRLVRPHPLAFVLIDFETGFAQTLPPEAVEPPITIRFVAMPHEGGSNMIGVAALAREELTAQSAEDRLSYVKKNHELGTVVLRPSKDTSHVAVIAAQGKAALPPLEVPGDFTGMALADLDWDLYHAKARPTDTVVTKFAADLDLVLFGPAGVRVFENRDADGSRRWIDRTTEAKIPALTNVRWLLAQDIDHDGNIDLVVGLEKGIRVFRNLGEMKFEEITDRSAGLGEVETIAAVAADFDRDGDLDIMCLTKAGKLLLLENQRGGRFIAKEQTAEFPKATTLLAFDANNDGRVDLLVGHSNGATLLLANEKETLPNGATRLEIKTEAAIRQMGYFDYDNDGWMDLWLLTDDPQKPLRLFRNVSGERFEEATQLLPPLDGPISAVFASDVDDDGDLDLLVAGPGGIIALRNDGGNANNWLDLRVRGVDIKDAPGTGQAAKVNYFNIGGTIEIRAGTHYQWQQVAGTVTHFGLGKRKLVDIARIIWTNGVPEAVIRPEPNKPVYAEQAPKGSCPFLFAWDGERFVMVTDCLWSSALGMKLAPEVYMDHHRQENHLIITADKLRPRDGEYLLQFTNELWEVPYLDQAELWVIEHPAEVEVFTNQRIGPPLDPSFRLRTVKKRHFPVAAKDHRGGDVLAVLNQRDKRFLGGFQRQRYVGLAEPHWLDLDLGDLSQAKQATLYLSGWIWPTDTSANVAISQDPRFANGAAGETGGQKGATLGGAQPPALLLPDGQGGWTTAIANMGFPCGKMQTVAVDLPLARFPKGDYRVRIATAMELYWHEAYFTVDEPDVPVRVAKLSAAKADLHYRGFSQMYQITPTSPFLFNYDVVDRSPNWLPIPGPYTRYGDVTELLARPDDRYVVMGVGDELTLRFAAPPPPPAGRKHTYLFYANGWLKDFDMNGGASETVGPLPFEAMSRYPYTAPESYPQTPEKRSFLRTYQTRDPNPTDFWNLMRPTWKRERSDNRP